MAIIPYCVCVCVWDFPLHISNDTYTYNILKVKMER